MGLVRSKHNVVVSEREKGWVPTERGAGRRRLEGTEEQIKRNRPRAILRESRVEKGPFAVYRNNNL